jgi:hypothetical protein
MKGKEANTAITWLDGAQTTISEYIGMHLAQGCMLIALYRSAASKGLKWTFAGRAMAETSCKFSVHVLQVQSRQRTPC